MNYYFKKFAKEKVQDASEEFIWLLYFSYCSILAEESDGSSFWENFKRIVREFSIGKKTASRIKAVASFLLRNLDQQTLSTENGLTKSKLEYLQVMNFRGFGPGINCEDKGISVKFNSNNTIFYGPNGSGKSSLCDALEYKLTGQVREALRRNKKVNEYIRRIGTTGGPSLSISFLDKSINGARLSEEERKFYSQAFIEKNRIQEFSLFGSKETGIKKEHILSILIGMDDLTKLAKSFKLSDSFKSNLESFKRKQVAQKIELLNSSNSSNLTLKKTHEETLTSARGRADKILAKTSSTLDDLNSELSKIINEVEVINSITLELSTNSIRANSKEEFQKVIAKLDAGLLKHQRLNEELETAKSQLSFLNLFTAIESLKGENLDTCPACDTPLINVLTNPFEKAGVELVKLEALKNREIEFNENKSNLIEQLKLLESLHNDLIYNTETVASLKTRIEDGNLFSEKPPQYSIIKLDEIDETLKQIILELDKQDNYFSEVETLFTKQTQRKELIEGNNEKVKQINERKSSIDGIKETLVRTQSNLDTVNTSLTLYSSQLEELNEEKKDEDDYNLFIDKLIFGYEDFYNQVQSFKDKEFSTKFGNLESEIAGFYNQISKHDPDHEAIDSFKINNSESDYKIEYKVKGATQIQDASLIFSEGHLRSLGLSILLANAKINGLPFIVFDDVVNAIDSDHRANIIDMMVNDIYLKETQQIVSTHDRFYWERFSLENKNEGHYSYILRCNKFGVTYQQYNVGFKEKIDEALSCYDIRQALLYCRIWFETISKQFCMENNIELRGVLKSRDFNVSIEPTLGSIYRIVSEQLKDNEHLKVLYDDEINYKGLNQEHHSFDEFNFNFLHSRTSQDVQKIYDAIIGLDDDMRFIKNYESTFDGLKGVLEDSRREIKISQS